MIKHNHIIQDQLNTPHDTVVEVHHVMITKNIIDNDLLEELAIITIELPLLHITLDLVTTTITEILAHIVHRKELLTDHLIDVIHVPVTNLDHTQEITTFHDTLLDRPPSRPRDSRYSRSRCHSQTRNKINNIQPQASTDPINFEIHMYHPTEMANALNPTSWFYSLYTHTSSNQNHRDYSSRLEISFLLDSGASISLLNHPTFITIAKLLNIKQNPPHNSSKTLTVANQTEVPILDYSTITLNTTIEDNSRQFTIPFAVADIKYNILGTPFFEENIQNINIQDFTLQFKHRMAFIQCSLTGTALSWYIHLNDSYKQNWHAFVQAFEKQFSSQKNAYYAQVEALSLIKKRTMKLFVILHLEFNNLVKKAGAMRTHQLSTSNATRCSQKDFQKTLRTLQTRDKLNILLLF